VNDSTSSYTRFQPQSEPQHATSGGDVPIDAPFAQPGPSGSFSAGMSPAPPGIDVGNGNSSSSVSAAQSTASVSGGAWQGPGSSSAIPLSSSSISSSSMSRLMSSGRGTGATAPPSTYATNERPVRGSGATGTSGGEWPGPGHAPSFKDPAWRSKQVESMLQRLQQLSWRRIDVSFQGSLLPFAHNHIQVTRRWLNWEGDSVAMHIAQLLRCTDLAYQELLQQGSQAHRPGPSPESQNTNTAAEGSQGTSAAASLASSLQGVFPGQVPQDEKERHERPL